METRNIKTPFSVFDIFSNIFPAIIFFTGIRLLEGHSYTLSLYINKINEVVSNFSVGGKVNLSYAFIVIALAGIIFGTGHALMSAGSMFIDRLLIGRGIGYPYLNLFNLETSPWRKNSSKFYLALCSLFIVYLPILLWLPRPLIFNIFIFHVSILVIVKLYIDYFRRSFKKQEKYDEKKLEKLIHKKYKVLLYIGFWAYLIRGGLKLINSIFRMEKFNEEFIANFKKIFKKKFNLDMDTVKDIDSSVFWLPYADIHENKQYSAQTLQFIRILYYFSRTLSISFYILFIACIRFQFVDGYNEKISILGTIYLLLGIIFFIHYYNIYFNFYSKQTFRTFYVHHAECCWIKLKRYR